MLSNVLQVEPYRTIMLERHTQDLQWGEQNHDMYTWLGILAEEFGEVAQAINDHILGVGEKYKEGKFVHEELIQTAAVAVAMLECGDRNGWWIPEDVTEGESVGGC